MRYSFLFLFLMVTICGCQSRKQAGPKFQKADLALMEVWKNDPLGCKKIRTEALALKIESLFLTVKNFHWDDLERYLGKTEYTHTRNQTKVTGYYFDFVCEGGFLKENSVGCSLEFFFQVEGPLEKVFVSCG